MLHLLNEASWIFYWRSSSEVNHDTKPKKREDIDSTITLGYRILK